MNKIYRSGNYITVKQTGGNKYYPASTAIFIEDEEKFLLQDDKSDITETEIFFTTSWVNKSGVAYTKKTLRDFLLANSNS